MNIKGKVSKEAKDNARLDRDRAANPADVEPGMDDDIWGSFDSSPSNSGEDLFNWGNSGSSSGGGNGLGSGGGFGNDGFGSGGFGGGFGGGLGGGFGDIGQSQKQKDDELEDKVFSYLGKFFKGIGAFLSEFVKSFKHFNYMSQLSMGKTSVIAGVIVAIVGLLLTLLGYGSVIGFPLLVGGLMSVGIGVPLFMMGYGTFVDNGGASGTHVNALNDSPVESESFSGDINLFADSNGFSDFDTVEKDPFEDDDFPSFDDDDDPYSLDDEDDEDDPFTFDDEVNFDDIIVEDTNRASADSLLDTLDNNNGMYTRQYLFEKIDAYLPAVNPNFDRIREIEDGDDEFDDWDAVIQSASSVFRPKGSDIEHPYLVSLKEKIFYYQLEVKRVNWLKNIDQFVAEIVNIVSYNETTGILDKSIYGVQNTVGDRIYIKVMKGTSAMLSIKDAYSKMANVVKDTSNFMPIIIGLDAEGNIVWKDFKSIESILVTGMPRSGKTWTVQSILTQMMFYLKPSELHIYILDPKEGISDYKSMKIPHIRKFVSTDATILEELRHIVRVEGPRRKKILGDAGFVNIWDYKKKNPDADLPLLYVVVDEVVTLAERMDKDTKDEFQGLLLELVSQLPALGIRIFMIPHLVKDQVLKKSITDLIPCRVSVRGDADHIEKSVGARNFKHKLIHQGDMAVRFNNDEPSFIHSAILTTSNEGNQELFDFLTKFWTKLDPEGYVGSLDWQEKTGSKAKEKLGYSGNTVSKPVRKPVDVTQTVSNSYSTGVSGSKPKLSTSEVSNLLKDMNDDDDLLDLFNKQ